MTKTEYAEYLKTDRWKQLRKQFMDCHGDCERCEIPRWLAAIAYDQDLNAHHKSYAHKGTPEEIDDLEALCRRCHEIETFGRSDLRAPKESKCEVCYSRHWDPRSDLCNVCQVVMGISDCFQFWATMKDVRTGESLWKGIIADMHFGLSCSGANATSLILDRLVEVDAIRDQRKIGISDEDVAPVDDEVPF